jgi:hydrogenase maturation protein HypF
VRERRKVRIRGLVQGVGFRETVRRIASRHAVAGSVRNVGHDLVEIDVEGEPEALDAFLDEVRSSPPPRARVDEVSTSVHAPQGEEYFAIAPSVR